MGPEKSYEVLKMKKEKSGPEKSWNWALILKKSGKSADIWS